jgi:glycosyltransferase involved in cell wall biosynthesis
LAKRGYDIAVLSYDKPDQKSFYHLDPKIEWIRLGIGHTDRPTTPPETTARILALRRAVSAMHPEIVIGFLHSMFIPMGLALLGTRIPLIASEHSAPAHYDTRPLQKTLMRLTPWLARRMTVVSDQILAQYPHHQRSNIVVIPNPVAPNVTALADVEGPANGRKTLLSVGRLAAQKDYATLIAAFALIAADFPDWDLRIIGEGDLRPSLETQIRMLGLESRIALPGATDAIYAEYQKAQLFVLPSLYESLGIVLIEALAHGLPAVGFADCPGTNKLIESGRNGILVAGRDRVAALASGLKTVMADPALRKSLSQPMLQIPEEYSIDKVVNRWEEVLNGYCGSKGYRLH